MSATETDLAEIVEKLSKLKVVDLAKLKKMLEDTWGVTAAAPAAVAVAAPASSAPAAAESTDFQITLAEAPADKKIAIIKVIREVTGLGLKEAKEMTDAAPKVVKESAPKAEAETIAKKLQEAGAKVTLKGL